MKLVETENKAFGKPSLFSVGIDSPRSLKRILRKQLRIAYNDLDVITCPKDFRDQETYIRKIEKELINLEIKM